MRIIGLFVIVYLFSTSSNAQNKFDSLLFAYENQPVTEKLKTALAISSYYSNDDLNKSLTYGKEALALANEFGSKKDLIFSNNRLGIIYSKLGNIAESNAYFLEALRISLESEESNMKIESGLMNNIAVNYGDLKQEELAIHYLKESFVLAKELEDSADMSMVLNNMALYYLQMEAYDSAYIQLKKAIGIDIKSKDSISLAYTKGSFGEVYLADGKADSAIHYLHQALDFFSRQPNNDFFSAYYDQKIGKALYFLNKPKEAKEHLEHSLTLATTIGAKAIQGNCYKTLQLLAEKDNDYKKALEYSALYNAIQDSLFREESAQKLSAIETTYQIKNKEQEISILNAKAEVDKLKFYSAAGTAVIVIILLGFTYYRYQFKAKANYELQQKNKTIKLQNSEIMESVEYAKGIQEAILPNFASLSSSFSQSYLYFKPSNVVSGDFYWIDFVGTKIILIVADGTGHGVPGAFLSVLGTGILRQIISEEGISCPNEILIKLNEKVREGLGQSKLNNTLKDGMDVAVGVWDKDSMEFEFTGAKRPMLLKKNGNVELVKGDRVSIGGDQESEPTFEVKRFVLKKGDSIVFFTDGIVDQFGGKEGKKFLSPQLVKYLESGNGIENLKERFSDDMDNWIGSNDQLDDMLLLGVEV